MSNMQNKNNGEQTSGKKVFGFEIRTWALIIAISSGALLFIFLILPFLIALFIPIFSSKNADHWYYLVDMLDGVAIVVGVVGTVASILSILMTLIDKRRYNQEKTQSEKILSSMTELHTEISDVTYSVKQTLDQNQRLGLALYNNNVIKLNPNLIDPCITTNTPNASRQGKWDTKEKSGEDSNE